MDREPRALNLLLVEDNRGDARLVELMLEQSGLCIGWLERRERLQDAIQAQRTTPADLVLLDLNLPDSSGLETFYEFSEQCEGCAVIVLTGLSDEDSALQAVRSGAQDYLVKGADIGDRLGAAIRYAFERNSKLQQQRELALYDPLTGLFNRRGFFALGEQQLQLARRRGSGLALLYLDVDNLKRANDRFGHQAGDRLLVAVADLLRETFRESDVLARVGGDEFVVLAIDTEPEDGPTLLDRLERKRQRINEARDLPLQISAGLSYTEGGDDVELEDLLRQADRMMYIEKDQHRAQSSEPKKDPR